jgi:quercetin dioxygenase-like cupin family protein
MSSVEVSPFGTWNDLEPFEIFPGVRLHAIGGEQVLLCRVSYEPGKSVQRHAHEHTEQVMVIVDGEVLVTIGSDRHHVPDRERDLVLGPEGGSQHVER